MRFSLSEVITTIARLVYFALTMAPLAALFLPWATLDGGARIRSGISCMTLLVSPIRDYLYEVGPVQAAILTLGPIVIVILSIVTSIYYYRRRSVLWTPPLLLLVALSIIYLTPNLVSDTYAGPRLVASVAILLIIHQAAIRIWGIARRNRRLSWISRPLAIATGIGRTIWR